MIYLDNAATTKMNKNALNQLVKYSSELFFNPSAPYHEAIENAKRIESVKKNIANKIGVTFKNNIIFTGSATEANNIAILGSVNKRSKQLIFSEGEHPSVYNTALFLKENGYDVAFVPLQSNGQINYQVLESLMQKETSFISVMYINNETGAINNIKKICELKNKYCKNAILHSDCVQAFGKILFSVLNLGIDLCTISAHKMHGPKGLGVLYFNSNIKLKPLIHGGGQEYSVRSGTENISSIMAFEKAIEETFDKLKENFEYVSILKNEFIKNISDILYKNNSSQSSSPYILSLSLDGVRGETLVHMLEKEGVIIGMGSACSGKKIGNRVLKSMGISNTLDSVRISFSPETSVFKVISAAKIFRKNYLKLKTILKV